MDECVPMNNAIATPLISATYLNAIIKTMEELDLDTKEILGKAGVSRNDISDPNAFISITQLQILVDAIHQFAHQPAVGLVFGSKLTLASHGMAGIAAMTQATFGDALKIADKFCDGVFPILRMEYVEYEHAAGIRITENIPVGKHRLFFTEAVFASFFEIKKYLLPDDARLHALHFSTPTPHYRSIYDRYFSCPILFDSEYDEYLVPKEALSKPLMMAEPLIAKMAEEHISANIQYLGRDFLPMKIKQQLKQQPGKFPSIETVSRNLGMSSRTLRRKLNELQTSYKEILNDAKQELAIRYLRSSGKTITEVAALLDFHDSSAFCKAFKRWTGMSPKTYRQQLKPNIPAQNQIQHTGTQAIASSPEPAAIIEKQQQSV